MNEELFEKLWEECIRNEEIKQYGRTKKWQ